MQGLCREMSHPYMSARRNTNVHLGAHFSVVVFAWIMLPLHGDWLVSHRVWIETSMLGSVCSGLYLLDYRTYFCVVNLFLLHSHLSGTCI
jgi:hypothetical protein